MPPAIEAILLAVLYLQKKSSSFQEFRAQFRFKQQWHDERLMFNDSYFKQTDVLHVAEYDKIWVIGLKNPSQ